MQSRQPLQLSVVLGYAFVADKMLHFCKTNMYSKPEYGGPYITLMFQLVLRTSEMWHFYCRSHSPSINVEDLTYPAGFEGLTVPNGFENGNSCNCPHTSMLALHQAFCLLQRHPYWVLCLEVRWMTHKDSRDRSTVSPSAKACTL